MTDQSKIYTELGEEFRAHRNHLGHHNPEVEFSVNQSLTRFLPIPVIR